MIIKSDHIVKNLRITEVIIDDVEYKRIEYKKGDVVLDIQWSITNRVNNHLDFDDIVDDDTCDRLEGILFDYISINELNENDILV